MRRSKPPAARSERPPRAAFLVLTRGGRGAPEVIDLPPGARLTAGSSPEDVILVEGSGVPAAALHLSWDGDELLVRAAGGGVYVEGKPFSGEALLEPGEEMAIGRHQLLFGLAPPEALGPRGALGHDPFVARLREELARAARVGRPTALVMLRVADRAGRLGEVAAATLRAGDLASSFAPNEPELLLPDTAADAAEGVVARLLSRLGERAHAGVAEAPLAGATPERLIWAAREALAEAIERDVDFARARPPEGELDDEWISEDPAFKSVEARLEVLSRTGEAVLFTGEVNSGKTVAARRLMSKSGARPGHATYVACAALDAAEARLAWAFGPVERPGGAIAEARSPFVVLELVSELSPEGQRRLAAAMDAAGRFRRYLSTTESPLEPLVERGVFDGALASRLTEARVNLPPLRSRPGDVIPLARRFAEMGGARRPELTAGAVARLRSYPWPGNVLELRNAMERAVRLARSGPILAEHLPADPLPPSDEGGRLREHVGEVERDTIIGALSDANHNQTYAARRLGISRRALIYKMEKYGLKPPPGHARARPE